MAWIAAHRAPYVANVLVVYCATGLSGIVRFGPSTVAFADGEWCGIELEAACGKNNGSVQGVAYFVCLDDRGMFVRLANVRIKAVQP